MNPWVFSQVKNKWAMSARRCANRNQVVFDTISVSNASSCCILDPGVTSWEQRQGQGNHYLLLMTLWRLYALKFLLFLLNSSLSSFGFDHKLFGTRMIFFSVWRRARLCRQALTPALTRRTNAGFADVWNAAFLSPGSSLFFSSCHPPQGPSSPPTAQLLAAFPLLLSCHVSIPISFSSCLLLIPAPLCQAESKSTSHPLPKPFLLPALVPTASSPAPQPDLGPEHHLPPTRSRAWLCLADSCCMVHVRCNVLTHSAIKTSPATYLPCNTALTHRLDVVAHLLSDTAPWIAMSPTHGLQTQQIPLAEPQSVTALSLTNSQLQADTLQAHRLTLDFPYYCLQVGWTSHNR